MLAKKVGYEKNKFKVVVGLKKPYAKLFYTLSTYLYGLVFIAFVVNK